MWMKAQAESTHLCLYLFLQNFVVAVSAAEAAARRPPILHSLPHPHLCCSRPGQLRTWRLLRTHGHVPSGGQFSVQTATFLKVLHRFFNTTVSVYHPLHHSVTFSHRGAGLGGIRSWCDSISVIGVSFWAYLVLLQQFWIVKLGCALRESHLLRLQSPRSWTAPHWTIHLLNQTPRTVCNFLHQFGVQLPRVDTSQSEVGAVTVFPSLWWSKSVIRPLSLVAGLASVEVGVGDAPGSGFSQTLWLQQWGRGYWFGIGCVSVGRLPCLFCRGKKHNWLQKLTVSMGKLSGFFWTGKKHNWLQKLSVCSEAAWLTFSSEVTDYKNRQCPQGSCLAFFWRGTKHYYVQNWQRLLTSCLTHFFWTGKKHNWLQKLSVCSETAGLTFSSEVTDYKNWQCLWGSCLAFSEKVWNITDYKTDSVCWQAARLTFSAEVRNVTDCKNWQCPWGNWLFLKR